MMVKIIKVLSIFAVCLTFNACQTPKRASAGIASAERPKSDVRKLRTTLTGKSMQDVIRMLGQPTDAYTLDEREIWNYQDTVRDSITGRPVHFLEIVFKKRVVQTVNFSF